MELVGRRARIAREYRFIFEVLKSSNIDCGDD